MHAMGAFELQVCRHHLHFPCSQLQKPVSNEIHFLHKIISSKHVTEALRFLWVEGTSPAALVDASKIKPTP